jgi:hypothetical protein
MASGGSSPASLGSVVGSSRPRTGEVRTAMSTMLVALAVMSTLVVVSALGVAAGRRTDGSDASAERVSAEPIVINLPRDARMRLVREQGLSYALEIDDTVRITGINVTQMARVAASLVDARGRAAASGSGSRV